MRVLTIYRDDSTTQVRYENVKHYFFTANNTCAIYSSNNKQENRSTQIHSLAARKVLLV